MFGQQYSETTDGKYTMSSSELERLKKLGELTDQVAGMADNDAEARQGIARLIARAEEDIKAKTREIHLQKSQIGLLKHLIAVLDKPKAPTGGRLQVQTPQESESVDAEEEDRPGFLNRS